MLSWKVDECKPLIPGDASRAASTRTTKTALRDMFLAR
jgi:hypothetical protein